MTLEANGAIYSLEEYFPFGETSFGSFHKKRYRYCGKERDEESGLYYYGARYYAAWTCRFVNLDPLAGSLVYQSPYCYAGNSPATLTDVDGLAPGGPGGDPKKAASSVSGASGGVCDNTGCNPDGTSQLPTLNKVNRPVNYATMATTATDGIQVQKPSTEQKLAENPNYERVYLAGGWNTKTKTTIFGPVIGYQKKSFAPPTTISEAKPGVIEILEAHLADLQSKPILERITIYGDDIASTANTINDLKAYLAGEENTNVRIGTMADVGLSIGGLILFGKGVQTSLKNGGSIPLSLKFRKEVAVEEIYNTALSSAGNQYKNTTVLAHSLSKHAPRDPSIWGKLPGDKSTWHDQAMNHFEYIMKSPGNFIETTSKPAFYEKYVFDGRGIRLNLNGTFKGFIDQ